MGKKVVKSPNNNVYDPNETFCNQMRAIVTIILYHGLWLQLE